MILFINRNNFIGNKFLLNILFIIFFLSFLPLQIFSKETNILKIELEEQDSVIIPLYEEVIIQKSQNDELFFTSENIDYSISLENIVSFSTERIEIEEANIKDTVIYNSSKWQIYTQDGILWDSGIGEPPLNSLPKGKLYIVKQGNFAYRIFIK